MLPTILAAPPEPPKLPSGPSPQPGPPVLPTAPPPPIAPPNLPRVVNSPPQTNYLPATSGNDMDDNQSGESDDNSPMNTYLPPKDLYNFPPNIDSSYLPPSDNNPPSVANSYLPPPSGDNDEQPMDQPMEQPMPVAQQYLPPSPQYLPPSAQYLPPSAHDHSHDHSHDHMHDHGHYHYPVPSMPFEDAMDMKPPPMQRKYFSFIKIIELHSE